MAEFKFGGFEISLEKEDNMFIWEAQSKNGDIIADREGGELNTIGNAKKFIKREIKKFNQNPFLYKQQNPFLTVRISDKTAKKFSFRRQIK